MYSSDPEVDIVGLLKELGQVARNRILWLAVAASLGLGIGFYHLSEHPDRYTDHFSNEIMVRFDRLTPEEIYVILTAVENQEKQMELNSKFSITHIRPRKDVSADAQRVNIHLMVQSQSALDFQAFSSEVENMLVNHDLSKKQDQSSTLHSDSTKSSGMISEPEHLRADENSGVTMVPVGVVNKEVKTAGEKLSVLVAFVFMSVVIFLAAIFPYRALIRGNTDLTRSGD